VDLEFSLCLNLPQRRVNLLWGGQIAVALIHQALQTLEFTLASGAALATQVTQDVTDVVVNPRLFIKQRP
jgi:hypothetical protein